MAQFSYGFALLFRNSPDDATPELLQALKFARRAGDPAIQARCLTYLALAARMRSLVKDADEYSRQTLEVAKTGSTREYMAAALANQSWVAIRSQDPDLAIARARQALSLWDQLALVFPFQWMALLPLLEASLLRDDLASALWCVDRVLHPTQQYLPGPAADAFARASRLGRESSQDPVREALDMALRHLESTEGGWNRT